MKMLISVISLLLLTLSSMALERDNFNVVSSTTPIFKSKTFDNLLEKIKVDNALEEDKLAEKMSNTPEYQNWYWDKKERCWYLKSRLKRLNQQDCPTGR